MPSVMLSNMRTNQYGLWLGLLLGVFSAAPSIGCVGDCHHECYVDVDDLVTMVNIALGDTPVSECTAGDPNGDGQITINEIISAVAYTFFCECDHCGDGVVDAVEECDDGGVCVGGTNAGARCRSAPDCQGEGVCDGGSRNGTACSSETDCAGGACIYCKHEGGDGCAANCTIETDHIFEFVAGQVSGNDISPGTSGIVIHGDILTLPIALQGQLTLTTGKPGVDGEIPVVIKAANMQFPAAQIPTLPCTCLRGIAAKTCGGSVFEADGTPSTDCTDGFTPGDSVCVGKKPCTFVHGAGNAAAGFIGCTGLEATNVTMTQDCFGAGGPVVSLDGVGGPGSAVLSVSTALGSVVGLCAGSGAEYGPDGQFCTNDDPQDVRGGVATFFLTTGTATLDVAGAGDNFPTAPTEFVQVGAPFDCGNLAQGHLSGVTLVGAAASCNQPSLAGPPLYNFVAR